MSSDTSSAGRPTGTRQKVEVPVIDYRNDLGPLGDGPPQLFAPPALLPIPVELIADEEWTPPHPVVVGAHAGAGWRYDCMAVSRRGSVDAGTLEVGVSAASEFCLVGIALDVDPEGRPPRYWWVPAGQVWIERPADDPLRNRRLAQEPPTGPPARMLTRVADADRVIGRHGWLAQARGWMPVVAVSDPWEAEVPDEVKARAGRAGQQLSDVYLNIVTLRSWWTWGAIGALDDDAVSTVEAATVWLE